MKKITLYIGLICAIFAFTFTAKAQTTSAQLEHKVAVSAEMQAQIQEAMSQQTRTSSQTSNRALVYTYVGSFKTNDGPYWEDNPDVLSGVEAAALLFGGDPSDYAISTDPNTTNPSTITHTSWATKWGVGDCHEVAEDYSLDLGGPGYNNPGGEGTATSAYVQDNCTENNTNYVWLIDFTNLFTWVGSESSDWNTAGNWDNGVPDETSDVIIPAGLANYPTISSAASCNNITLQSNAAGTASLIDNGFITVNGTATIERYLTGGWGEWDAGWHQISSPVAAQPILEFASGNYDFYGWEEADNTWINYKGPNFSTWNGGTNFNVGQGYWISYDAATTTTFIGELNNTDEIITGLTKTDMDPAHSGWHLLGNPFASAIKWNDGNWALNNVSGVAKIWSLEDKAYTDNIDENDIIPSAQGFMVQVNSDINSITIPAASRVHNAKPYYKSSKEQLLLVAAETEHGSAQESKIILNSMATEGFDFEYDSRFLEGDAPLFYSVVGDEKVSTNSLPSIDAGLVIPFDFVKNAASDFTITLKESLPGQIVYLTDNKAGKVTNLTENQVYNFTSLEGDDANRFAVTFGTLGINNPEEAVTIHVYAYGDVLYLQTPSKESALVNVYNLTGQLVMQAKTNGGDLNTLNASALSNGIYVVNVVMKNSVVSRKVSIRK